MIILYCIETVTAIYYTYAPLRAARLVSENKCKAVQYRVHPKPGVLRENKAAFCFPKVPAKRYEIELKFTVQNSERELTLFVVALDEREAKVEAKNECCELYEYAHSSVLFHSTKILSVHELL